MPRTYKRKPGARTYSDYNTNKLNEAIHKILSGEMSQREAAEKYKIPRSTLVRKIKGQHQKSAGGQTIIDSVTENLMKEHILQCSAFGFPLDGFDVRCLVKTHLDRSGVVISKFKDNFPGKDWFKSFLRRHPDLTERMASNIKKQRAKVSPEIINQYFDELEVETAGIPASNIYNFDETNLTDDPGTKKVVTKRGIKYPERILNSSKSSTSIMICGNAEGHMLSPYVVYKSKELWSTWTQGGPAGCRYNRTMSGWFDSSTFDDWFNTVVLPALKKLPGTKVLIGDNLSSHLNIDIIKQCQAHDIKFICLPPNSTHLTQPLDLAFFRPMKGKWRKILLDYKLKTNKSPIPKNDFPKLFKKLITELSKTSSESLVNGFEKSGIYPLDRTKILERLPTKETQNHDDQEVASRVNDSVLAFLHGKRYGEGESQKPGRKKKVKIAPGKSVSAEDFVDEEANQNPSTSGTQQLKQRRGNLKKRPLKEVRDSDTTSEDESNYSVYSEFEEESFDEEFLDATKTNETNCELIGKKFEKRKKEDKKYEGETSKKEENCSKTKKTAKHKLDVGSFVIFIYEGEYFPGVVEAINKDTEVHQILKYF